jgi:hypothetical protein
MKRISDFNTFITERLGILTSLEDIADKILKELSGKKYYRLETEYLGNQIKIDCYLLKPEEQNGRELSGSFRVEDPDNFEFSIKMDEISKSTLIHELKHMDRSIRRKMKTDNYFYINHIGRYVADKYRHLFTTKENAEVLIETLYYCNPDEFEAYFNDIYYELKEQITPEMSKLEIRNIVKETLEDEEVYIFFKQYYKSKFDIEDFFKSKRDCNYFLSEFFNKMDKFFTNEDDTISNSEVFFSWIKSALSISEENVSTSEINHLINRIVQKNFKKFGRLYTLLLD